MALQGLFSTLQPFNPSTKGEFEAIMNQNRHKVTYQTTSNYHLAMGGDVSIHSDITQQFEARDALDAAQKTIEAIRESAPIRAIVINLVIVVSLKV